jgi:hypothetical protein
MVGDAQEMRPGEGALLCEDNSKKKKCTKRKVLEVGGCDKFSMLYHVTRNMLLLLVCCQSQVHAPYTRFHYFNLPSAKIYWSNSTPEDIQVFLAYLSHFA